MPNGSRFWRYMYVEEIKTETFIKYYFMLRHTNWVYVLAWSRLYTTNLQNNIHDQIQN